MEALFETIRKKYRDVKRAESDVDPLALKSEIESYIRRLQATEEKNDDLLEEAQDMLIDLTKIIEEGHCHPFKPKKL
ncbi:MAG: hypothetical protein ACLFU9_02110 [Candidatus Bathyarchaeia archaeon]